MNTLDGNVFLEALITETKNKKLSWVKVGRKYIDALNDYNFKSNMDITILEAFVLEAENYNVIISKERDNFSNPDYEHSKVYNVAYILDSYSNIVLEYPPRSVDKTVLQRLFFLAARNGMDEEEILSSILSDIKKNK